MIYHSTAIVEYLVVTLGFVGGFVLQRLMEPYFVVQLVKGRVESPLRPPHRT